MKETKNTCYYCMIPIYIKAVQNNQKFNAPISQAEAIQYELFKRTGYCYQQLEHKYCPMCGRRLEDASM